MPDKHAESHAFRSPEELVALRSSDRDAISTVYREHHAALRTFAHRLLGDFESAENLVQDRLRAASTRALQPPMRGEPARLLVRHGRQPLPPSPVRRHAPSRSLVSSRSTEAEALANAPDEALITAWRAQVLRRALDRLPLDKRTTFVLCEVEQCSTSEAAAILGVPGGHGKSSLFSRAKFAAAVAAGGEPMNGELETYVNALREHTGAPVCDARATEASILDMLDAQAVVHARRMRLLAAATVVTLGATGLAYVLGR